MKLFKRKEKAIEVEIDGDYGQIIALFEDLIVNEDMEKSSIIATGRPGDAAVDVDSNKADLIKIMRKVATRFAKELK